MVDYRNCLKDMGVRFSVAAWFSIAVAIAAVVFAFFFLFMSQDLKLIGLLGGLLVIILFSALPILMKQRRDQEIEDSIPDVMEELSTSLRAGATIEQAITDIIKLQKGPLTEELKLALRDMEAGLGFEEALQGMIDRIDVKMLKQILTIIIDGRRAGSKLADILDSVANDVRELSRIKRERISKTMMHSIFIFAAGAVIAPVIFAFVAEMGVIITSVAAISGGAQQLITLLQLYLIIETIASGVMLSVIRGERFWKGLGMYGSSMALIANIVFIVTRIMATSMFVPA